MRNLEPALREGKDNGLAVAAAGLGADAHQGYRMVLGERGNEVDARDEAHDLDVVRLVEAVAEGVTGPDVALTEGLLEGAPVPVGDAGAGVKADVDEDGVGCHDAVHDGVELAAGVAEGVDGVSDGGSPLRLEAGVVGTEEAVEHGADDRGFGLHPGRQ